jgi:hypothetical protein
MPEIAVAGMEPMRPAQLRQDLDFHSILFPEPDAAIKHEAPGFFHDLNLDQVVAAITAGRQDYELAPFFHTPLHELDVIAYRQEVMRELEGESVLQAVQSFSSHMRSMREHLVQRDKLIYENEKARWFLGAVESYCDAVGGLADGLREQVLEARGLRAFRAYLLAYAESDAFSRLAAETRKLAADLSAIRYCLLIDEDKVTVRPFEGEADSGAAVEETFQKFRRDALKDYRATFKDRAGMDHIEAQVLDRVALLNPDTFGALDRYCTEHADYLDGKLADFEREIQFYLAYLAYMETFRRAGLEFCYPQMSDNSKAVAARNTYDPALAYRLVSANTAVVCNDFALRDPERILVVSGPNQGGKTTFARMFGVLHYLASLGCPVPGSEARLFLFRQIHTHFEREEDIRTLRGKLEDDLVRIRRILQEATPDDVFVINEIFASTSLKDAVDLGKKIVARISGLDALCVCVTFLDELASFNEKTVSMVSTVDPANPERRTFRLERRPAEGLAYALAIAERYRVTYASLKARIAS